MFAVSSGVAGAFLESNDDVDDTEETEGALFGVKSGVRAGVLGNIDLSDFLLAFMLVGGGR